MRIIAGKFKGRKLNTFEISTTRPTSDMVREALFNKIGYDLQDCVFLDLFCGTGACGIEAISRGAEKCFFVDKNIVATKLTQKNLAIVGAQNAEVVCADFDKALKRFAKQNIKFDIVFLDPPYATDNAEIAIGLLTSLDLLNLPATIVWEHDRTKLKYIEDCFADAITKKYGEKYLTYIVVEDENVD